MGRGRAGGAWRPPPPQGVSRGLLHPPTPRPTWGMATSPPSPSPRQRLAVRRMHGGPICKVAGTAIKRPPRRPMGLKIGPQIKSNQIKSYTPPPYVPTVNGTFEWVRSPC